jgi:hypothetical protein
LLVNFNHRGLARLAGICRKINSSNETQSKQAQSVKLMVDAALGGDWWLSIMGNQAILEEERPISVMNHYAEMYRTIFKWLVLIPVPESFLLTSKPKYYLIFGTQSKVAFELMNDCVTRANSELRVAEIMQSLEHSLFSDAEPLDFLPNRHRINEDLLEELVLKQISGYNEAAKIYGGALQDVLVYRQAIRLELMKKCFAEYTAADYNRAITRLLKRGELISENGKSRISDAVGFYLAKRSL